VKGSILALQLSSELISPSHSKYRIEVDVEVQSLSETIRELRKSVVRVNVWKGQRKYNGSGFFVSKDGHLITCEHVVRPDGNQPTRIEITMDDGRSQTPSLLYTDVRCDLAVLKLDIQSAPLLCGSYDSIEPGDEVMFLGYPIGVPCLTVHKGMISAKGKEILPTFDCNLLQIDGTINLGNSGGPLVKPDTKEVIGVVTAKYGLFLKDVKEFAEYVETIQPIGRGVVIMGVDFGSLVNFVAEGFNRLARALVLVQVGIGYAVSIDYAKQYLEDLVT